MEQKRPGRNGGTLNIAQPGNDGQGGGRPKGSKSFATLFDKILSGEMDITEAGKTRRVTKKEALVLALTRDALSSESPDVRLRAFREIMDRIEGKPKQVVEQSGSLAITGGIEELTPDQAEKTLEIIRGK